MANQTSFAVSRGEFQSKCLPQTQQFIEMNLNFFHQAVAEINSALGDEGDIVLVSNEEQWNFAAKIERTELGNIVEASGSLIEGGRCKFDEAVANL